MRDTYLTNLRYQGSALDVRFERVRRVPPPHWDNHQWLEADLMYGATDRNGNSSMHAGRLRYRYGMHRYLYDRRKFDVAIGCTAGADLGFNYNLKMASSNNPATVRATLNAGISVKVHYRYKIRQQYCFTELQAQTPMLGAALMPEYGASYYETFYLKHADHNMHFTSLHNQQDLDVRLSTCLPFAIIPHMTRYGTALRVGVAYHIETMDINHIITRQSSLLFLVGWTWQHLPYNPARR